MVCALGAAVCFGTATVLQAMAARAVATGPGGDLAPLWRALRQWRYLVGLGMDGLGFLLQIVALRSVPIYTVGAAPAASLAVTAVVAARLLGVRLSRMEWAAVGAVCAGLAVLGPASGVEGDQAGPVWLRWAMLAAAGGVLLFGGVAGRLPERGRALALGGVRKVPSSARRAGFAASSACSGGTPGRRLGECRAPPAYWLYTGVRPVRRGAAPPPSLAVRRGAGGAGGERACSQVIRKGTPGRSEGSRRPAGEVTPGDRGGVSHLLKSFTFRTAGKLFVES
jgi:hypothetical protein